MTIHHPHIRGAGQVVKFPVGRIIQGAILGAELIKYAYYSGHITDDFKVNKDGHVIHSEDKTENKTAVWRKHFK